MTDGNVKRVSIDKFPLLAQSRQKRVPFSFDLELTARCNNNCKHCYINLPVDDIDAQKAELTKDEILSIASQAVEMGAIWCLITGGEPLLRKDFPEIYLSLKKLGLIITVFTNACFVKPEHIDLFQRYPPHDLEVTVYGATKEVYERVTRKPGSYNAFRRGLSLLFEGGVKVRLKAVAIRSNFAEMEEIAEFSRSLTSDFYRFDPMLHLRYDKNEVRNDEIKAERLSPAEIAALEQADPERFDKMQQDCEYLILDRTEMPEDTHLFYCGAGINSFSVGYDGTFRLCSALNREDCVYDLRKASLKDAWLKLVPAVRAIESNNPDFKDHCHSCSLVNLCLWCPAHADLEVNALDGRNPYFCQVAYARAKVIKNNH